jgi:RNA polymerase sigma factor (sigma-70 family)
MDRSIPNSPEGLSYPYGGTTRVLLARARNGDPRARDLLFKRLLQPLQRWAHGRLPDASRGMVDTDDLVQVTLIRALDHLEEFEPEREGALLAYLRRTLVNLIRDEVRRTARRPRSVLLDAEHLGNGPSPLDSIVAAEDMARFERGLLRLSDQHQQAIILRIEFGYTYSEIAEAIGCNSQDAARMLVTRSLIRLAREMNGSRR